MSIMIWRPSKESFCKNWSKLWEVAVQRMQGLQELPNTSPANISQIFHCPQTAANIWLPWECCKYLDRQISGKCDGGTKWWLMVPWGQKAGVGWEIVISYYCWWPRSYIKSWFFFLIVTDVIGFLGYFAKNVGIWDENDGKERFVKMWEKERSSFSSQCNSLIISLLQITALPKWLC